jgi:hypothetical protein
MATFLRLTLIVSAILILGVATNATPIESDTDLWQGAQILGSSPLGAGFDARDIFGAHESVNPYGERPGWTIFQEGNPVGTVVSVSWMTAAPVSFDRVLLFATADIYAAHGMLPRAPYRGISHFTLYSDAQLLIDTDIQQAPDQEVALMFPVAVTVGQNFTAYFTQASTGGARIKELDAVLTPEPGTLGLLGLGATALAWRMLQRARQRSR